MDNKFDKNKIVGIDGRCLLDTNYTGVSEYTVVLIKKLLKDYPDKEFVIFLNSFKTRGIQERLAWLRKYKNIRIKHYHYPSKVLNFSLWFFKYPKIDKMLGGVDIFIAPNISFLAISKDVKFILTVHDLSFERFKETFSWKRRFWHFIINPRKLCQQANEIWTVSTSTKWDLESLYKIANNKIKIKPIVRGLSLNINNNDQKNRLKKVRDKYRLPKKFILYLGTIEPRKNIINLVQAFEYLKKNKKIEQKYKLVIAGQLGWQYKEIVDYIKKSKFKDCIVLTNFVDQQDKAYFYRLATTFVYPSLFEGFGIPLLEAMANGTPVITSNNSSIPEVVGQAGIMVDPDRVDDLIDAIELIITDKKIQEYYIKKGFEQTRKVIKNSNQTKLI
jgi:glycosyltransferase involved in cell wall biosynthesis